jgi:hypothetical protein
MMSRRSLHISDLPEAPVSAAAASEIPVRLKGWFNQMKAQNAQN